MFFSKELDAKDAAPVTEDTAAVSKRPGFSGTVELHRSSQICRQLFKHESPLLADVESQMTYILKRLRPLVSRVLGVQAVQNRPGQHAARAGPRSLQQEVWGGIGHQVPRPSALQKDQEQPGLGHHRGPSPRHPLQEALHLRLPEPGEDPGCRWQNQLHHHQVRNADHSKSCLIFWLVTMHFPRIFICGAKPKITSYIMHKFKCFHQIRFISVYRSSFLQLMAWIFITVFKYMSANSVHCACFIVLHADHFKDLFQNQVWARCALLSWHLIYYAASITESKTNNI